jgi:hypothetical protein
MTAAAGNLDLMPDGNILAGQIVPEVLFLDLWLSVFIEGMTGYISFFL